MSVKRTIIRLMGGLGNQMFQYAAARNFARATGSSLFIDISALRGFSTPREYALSQFPLGASVLDCRILIPTGADFALLYPSWSQNVPFEEGTFVRRIIDGVARLAAKRIAVYRESSGADMPSDVEDVILVGYWQSPKYFAASFEQIRREFDLSSIVADAANSSWLDRISASESVAVHVRRGDYLQPEIVARFGLCSQAYFEAAMARMRERLDRPRFFVFSDDIEWCQGLLAGPDVEFVTANPPSAPVSDLRLIAACRHQIISNSSFSWWGAWLAARPNIVVAPRPWYSEAMTSPDLPDYWCVLDRETGAGTV